MNDLDLLLHQTRHLYTSIASAIRDVDFAAARFALGEQPSIAWLTGHMLAYSDSTAEAVTGAERAIEDRGSEVHWGCQTAADWEALREDWSARALPWLADFESLKPEDLDRAPLVEILPAFKDRLLDRRRFWSGHVFHMGYHLGQVGTLRAELGLGWWTD